MITPFTGKPSFRSTALPTHGQTLIRLRQFPRILFPAKFCTRAAVGLAIRERRVV